MRRIVAAPGWAVQLSLTFLLDFKEAVDILKVLFEFPH